MTKKEIEYPDAPSGNVTFYNYKEPLMKFDDGHGFIGALLFDTETDKVQCHFCGEWYFALSPHIAKEHNMTASAYKEKVGLFQTTALIGEKMRAKLIASGLDKRLQNLRVGGKKSQSTIEKTRATLIRNAQKPEMKNLRGTCPAQLIDRLQKIYAQEGKNFNSRQVQFGSLLKKTFGSIQEAYRLANVPYRKSGLTMTMENKKKDSEQNLIDFVKEFVSRFNREPKYKDFVSQGKKYLYQHQVRGKKNMRKIMNIAYASMNEYKHSEDRVYYSKKNLIDFLIKFEKSNGRKPSYSDCKRKLLPSLQRYNYQFGGWQKALSLAFPS